MYPTWEEKVQLTTLFDIASHESDEVTAAFRTVPRPSAKIAFATSPPISTAFSSLTNELVPPVLCAPFFELAYLVS